jgi:hypothetical protein
LVFRSFIENLLRVSDVPGTKVLMLPLAYAIGSVLNSLALWFVFKIDFDGCRGSLIAKSLNEIIFGSLVVGLAAYFSLDFFDNIFSLNTFYGVLLQGLCAGIVGILGGVVVFSVLKNREFISTVSAFSKKFWKRPVVAEAQSDL